MMKDILRHWSFTTQVALNAFVGYLFMKFLASNWGTSSHKDAFDVAYSVPFMLMSMSGFVFFEALIAAKFSGVHSKDFNYANDLFSGILSYLLLCFTSLVVLAAMFSIPLTELLAPGLQGAAKHEAVSLIVLLMPLVLVLGVGSFLSSILTAYGVPVGAEVCQAVSRMGIVGSWWIFGYAPTLNETALSLCVFGAVGLAFLWMMFTRVTGFHYKPRLDVGKGKMCSLMSQGFGLLLTAVLAQVAMGLLRALASMDGVGSIAMMTYALALIYPLSILAGKPLALVMGPRYIRYLKSGDVHSAKWILLSCCVGLFLVTMSMASAIYWNAREVVGLAFGGGLFDASAAEKTGRLLELAVWALPAEAISRVLLMPLLSDGRMHAVSIIYSTRYILQMVISYPLFVHHGRNGLMVSYVIAVGFQVLFEGLYLFRFMVRRMPAAVA